MDSYTDKNPIEARQILGKYTNLPQQVTEKIPLPAYEASLKPNQIDIWINVLKDLNLLPLPIEASKIVLSN